MDEEPHRRLGSHVAGSVAVAAVFVVALIMVFLVGRSPEPPPADPSPTAAPVAQSTLLVQVTLGRTRAASLLVATGGQQDQAVLLDLPQDVLLADGSQYTPVLDANLSLNRRLTAQALQSTLGVRVDGGWRMERKALAGMVDSVGTVTVSVSEPTTFLDEASQPVLRLPVGESKLAGPQASWYAIGVVQGADPIAGIQARTTEVFTKAVAQLSDDPEQVAAMLTSLGALSDPLEGTTAVSEQLVALRADLVAGTIQPLALTYRASALADPVVTRQSAEGGVAPAVGAFRVVEYAQSGPAVRTAFATSPRIADVDGPPRVLVWNATDEPLSTHVALLELTDAGYLALGAGMWTSEQDVSQLNGMGYLLDGESYVAGVAAALRLTSPLVFGDVGTASPVPTSTPAEVPVMPPADQTPWGDVDVVLGADYAPCPVDEPTCLEELP